MPFITKARRSLIDMKQLEADKYTPGDRCYLHYKHLVEEWRKKPCWTTADALYREVLSYNFTVEAAAAAQLAWAVFFQLYVMPYEAAKRKENGDI